jgi:hypothetical protein
MFGDVRLVKPVWPSEYALCKAKQSFMKKLNLFIFFMRIGFARGVAGNSLGFIKIMKAKIDEI